jgi:hypothetical protein
MFTVCVHDRFIECWFAPHDVQASNIMGCVDGYQPASGILSISFLAAPNFRAERINQGHRERAVVGKHGAASTEGFLTDLQTGA